MEVKLSEERIMSIFGHVSPQFHGYAPFSIELGSNGDITHDQPSGLATLNRHIIQNPDIMKVFQEASPEFIKETILPVLKDACNSLSSKNIKSVQQQSNPNLIYIKTTDQVPSIPIYKNPNLIHIETWN